MKRRYRFRPEHDFDNEIDLEIDFDLLTEELAAEINGFWTGSDARLAAADEDVRMAAAMHVAAVYMNTGIQKDYNAYGMHHELDNAEGFPPNTSEIFRILHYQRPEMIGAEDLEVKELTDAE